MKVAGIIVPLTHKCRPIIQIVQASVYVPAHRYVGLQALLTNLQISLAFSVTAGLAFCFMFANYIFAYDPDLDPFGTAVQPVQTSPRSPFNPNPIDLLLLQWRLGKSVTQTKAHVAKERVTRIREALEQVRYNHLE